MKYLPAILLFGSLGWFGYTVKNNPKRIPILDFLGVDKHSFDWSKQTLASSNSRENVLENYETEVLLWGEFHDLSPAYLLSLIVLECGGHKPCGSRFEPKRFKQLKNLRDGKRRKFEYLRKEDLKGMSDAEIRELATSWGPFQIMGYHTIGLSKTGEAVTVADLTGPRSIEIGIRWIDENYGTLLRNERFKDSFHMHNTGRTYPKVGGPRTHDPNYVSNGLANLSFFDARDVDGPTAFASPSPNGSDQLGSVEPEQLEEVEIDRYDC